MDPSPDTLPTAAAVPSVITRRYACLVVLGAVMAIEPGVWTLLWSLKRDSMFSQLGLWIALTWLGSSIVMTVLGVAAYKGDRGATLASWILSALFLLPVGAMVFNFLEEMRRPFEPFSALAFVFLLSVMCCWIASFFIGFRVR